MLPSVLRFCKSSRAAPRLSRRCYTTRTTKADATKTAGTGETSNETPAIPPLRRPLGVQDVPTTKTKTLSERSADFLNQEKQLEKRRHLCVAIFNCNSVDGTIGSRVKEASTGYFHDLHMTRVHGGKTWMAPNVLIREDVRFQRLFSL